MNESKELVKQLTQVALRYLGYRDRLQAEVVTRLRQEVVKKKYGPQGETAIPQVIAKLEKLDLLDDTRFITQFVHTQLNSKLRGPYRISSRLFQLGADRQLVNSLLPQLISDQQQSQAIATFITKKYPQGITTHKDKIKLYHQLKRRGFHSRLIQEKIDASVSNELQYP